MQLKVGMALYITVIGTSRKSNYIILNKDKTIHRPIRVPKDMHCGDVNLSF